MTPQTYMVRRQHLLQFQSFAFSCLRQVLRNKCTEPGHRVRVANGGFDDHVEKGTYICAGCQTPLYTDKMKFDCGCGWPGFWGCIPD
eukprot:SAG31_NODE_20918_length_562_cov_0.987041_1_plen_86_part_01